MVLLSGVFTPRLLLGVGCLGLAGRSRRPASDTRPRLGRGSVLGLSTGAGEL